MSANGHKLRSFVEANFSGGVGTSLWMNSFRKDGNGGASAPVSKSLLTMEQRQQYEEQGYLVVQGLMPAGLMAQVSRMDIALEQRQKLDAEAQERLERTMRDLLSQYRRTSQVVDWVEQFCGAKVLSLGAMYVSVPPGGAGQLALHQNANFLPFPEEEERVVSVWTAIDCPGVNSLFAVPGSHKGPALQHSVEDGVIIDPMFEDVGAVAVDAPPGDAVFIHPRLVHGTAPNRSSAHRKEMISHYAHCNVRYIDKPSSNKDYWKDSAYIVRSADSRL
ncbi:phytanoyl-CoA dioxygenase, peroxisomal-like isoform X2 [Dermacentor variabilis]|uniref:phytanoyl-CoA dioxygenase, peroxisomal-like isoform X2 n=1 Tax=Dermacentor variabilis TaxID=34621 RepID=UPI003F5BD167